jgi:anion transporter
VGVGGNIAKMFMIAIPVVSSVTSSAIIVGASVDIFAADLFNTMVGYKWTYFSWLVTNLPFCFVMTLLVYALALLVFRPESDTVAGSEAVIREKIEELGRMSSQEKIVFTLFALLMLLWFTDASERIPAEMLVAFIIVFPGPTRLLTMKQAMASVNWNVALLFGASLSMASGLQSSGAVSWMAENVFSRLSGVNVSIVALLVIAFTAVVRLGMTNMTGAAATLLPILVTVAQGIGVNPVWLGMLCVMSTCVCFFFPSQSPNNLFPYGFGYYEGKDLLRFGLAVFPVYAAVLTLFAVYYWPLVTLPIHSVPS